MTRFTVADLGLTPAFAAGYAAAGTYRPNRFVHILVDADFKAGRITRKRGDSLCGTSAALYRQGTNCQITCPRCIELANTITKYQLPDGKS